MAHLSPSNTSTRNRALERKLVAYSAAALVALAVPGRALAQIQYIDEDPDVVVGVNDSYDIDFDGDGDAEFQLRQNHNVFSVTKSTSCTYTYGGGRTCVTHIFSTPRIYTTDVVEVVRLGSAADDQGRGFMGGGYPSALNSNETVSINNTFSTAAGALAFSSNRYSRQEGEFRGQTDKLMGLLFKLSDGAGGTTTHYGWVRLDVGLAAGGFTVKSHAYEDTPGGSIVTFMNPAAVTLSGFTATPSESGILLQWETSSESNSAGFNLYRSTDASAPGDLLNETLIASEAPGSSQGAAYQWLDASAEAGVTSSYWLEAVDTSGSTQRFGPVSATIEVPTALALDHFSASGTTLPHWQWGAFGLAALATVLRRRKSRRQQRGQRLPT